MTGKDSIRVLEECRSVLENKIEGKIKLSRGEKED